MGRRKRRGARLELTSLLDVMFLVLVFFIYAVFDMAVHRGIKVELPSGAGNHEKGARIVVTILADDSMQLDGVSATRREIVRRIEALNAGANGAEGSAKPSILVSGDKAASLESALGLLSDLKRAGVESVSFQVAGNGAPDAGNSVK